MKVEELSDDLADSLKVSSPEHTPPSTFTPDNIPGPDLLTQAMMNALPSSTATPSPPNPNGTSGAPLPPAMASIRSKTTTEILSDLNSSPLFMTDLEENADLDALKALAYEGTPYEVSLGFKERGNESFQERRWGDAKEFYGKGIQVLLIEVRRRQRGEKRKVNGGGDGEEEEDQEEIKREIGVLETCLVNRAACHLELKNYRSCTLDCASALRINPRNIKAFYRSSRALLLLGKILEADDSCARGLAIDPSNASLKKVAESIIKKSAELAERRKMEAERETRKRLEEVTLRTALKARGIKIRKTAQPPEMEDASISLTPDPIDPTSTLTFPTILLYPLHLESDFIKAFSETEPLSHHLSYILPLPWDTKKEYTPNSTECYMETTSGGLIKVGKKVSLLKVLSGNVEVVDEVVRIFVVPKARSEEWVLEFKRKKAGEKTI